MSLVEIPPFFVLVFYRRYIYFLLSEIIRFLFSSRESSFFLSVFCTCPLNLFFMCVVYLYFVLQVRVTIPDLQKTGRF